MAFKKSMMASKKGLMAFEKGLMAFGDIGQQPDSSLDRCDTLVQSSHLDLRPPLLTML